MLRCVSCKQQMLNRMCSRFNLLLNPSFLLFTPLAFHCIFFNGLSFVFFSQHLLVSHITLVPPDSTSQSEGTSSRLGWTLSRLRVRLCSSLESSQGQHHILYWRSIGHNRYVSHSPLCGGAVWIFPLLSCETKMAFLKLTGAY